MTPPRRLQALRRYAQPAVAIASAALLCMAVLTAAPAQAARAGAPAPEIGKPVPGSSAHAISTAASSASSRAAAAKVSALPRPQAHILALRPGTASPSALSTKDRYGKRAATVAGPWTSLGSTGIRLAAAQPPATANNKPSRAAAQTVSVEVVDEKTAKKHGLSGLVLKLTRTGTTTHTAPLAVQVPDAVLSGLYGADYASRVDFSQLPNSSATTAGPSEPVAQTADPQASAVVLTPMVGAASVLVATTSSSPISSTGTGSFAATPLKPSSLWDVSAQTGDFSWSYPLKTPPVAAGPTPSLALSYDSQSVDGETGSTNNQPSAIGDGWSLAGSGFIERSYVPCASDSGASGAVTTSGDLCWSVDNATLSFAGHSGQLVKDSATGAWKLQNDDGTRIEHLVGTAQGCAANGTYDTDCWRVTTIDGTQYYFGLNELPGWASGKATTNSTWTVPVFGNDTGEPCHASTFAASSCQQAWRWNLDYVVDAHGNAEAFYYDAETNKYAADGTGATSYTRGGQLDHIDYGFRSGQAYATNAASQKVVFGYDAYGRCSDTAHTNCTAEAITSAATAPAHPTYYPDVPFDQYCTSTSCTTHLSPTFFTDEMLDTITTEVLSGSAYAKVDSWALGHSFPSPGDGTSAALWLTSVTHTGWQGTASLAEPPTTFSGTTMQNRVWVVDGLAPLDRYRITSISTSLGAVISIAYSAQQCTADNAAAIEAAPQSNTNRCFPQFWVPQVTPPQAGQEDLFHKYLVTAVITDPKTGGGNDATQETDYVYTGSPAWRYDDSPLTPAKYRTWSQFAGYDTVEVRVGDHSAPGSQQVTDYTFYRGMDGDRASASGGTKSVDVTGFPGTTDSRWLAGQTKQTQVRDGVGGPVTSTTVDTPWASGVTASDGTSTARMTGAGTETVTDPLSTGGTRTTTTTTTHETTYGLPTTVSTVTPDAGSTCTSTTYTAANTTAWIIGLPAEVATVAVACDSLASAIYPKDAVSDVKTAYDGLAVGAAPTKGDATSTQAVDSYSGATAATAHWVTHSQTAYDAMGRVTQTTDANGNVTKTAYTPAAGAANAFANTAQTVTDPLGDTTTTAYLPAWGAPASVTNANGGVASATYDALGRTLDVWTPDHPQSANASTPVTAYAYTLSKTAPNAVATTTLTSTGTPTSYALYDGLGQQVQTQSLSEGTGTMVTDTGYDSAGRKNFTAGPYWTTSVNPSTALFIPTSLSEVGNEVTTSFDGAGRTTATVTDSYGSERFRTTYAYLGADRVDTTPPAGGTPSSVYTDSLSRQVKTVDYLDSSVNTSAKTDATGYSYDARGDMTGMTDPAGNHWAWAFDPIGRQISATDPDTGTTTSSYDANGNLKTSTDARGTELVYDYDALNRKTAEYQGGDGASGALLDSWVYDTVQKGQLTSSTSYQGSTTGTPGAAYTTSYTGYDAAGRPTGSTVSIPGAAPAFAGTSYTTTTAYNVDGTPKTTSLPAVGGLAAEHLKYSYDGLGNYSALYGTQEYGAISYTAIGQVSQYARDAPTGGVSDYTDYGYDPATGGVDEIKDETINGSTFTTVADRNYTRTDSGEITKAANTLSATSTDTQCYNYDQLQQLTQVWTPSSGDCTAAPDAASLGGPAPYWQSYTYDDATGNRTAATQHATAAGTPDTVATYTYPGAGAAQPHAVSQVQTDTGSLASTESFGYNPAGDATTIGALTAGYDAAGKTSTVSAGGATQTDVYDAGGNLLLQSDPQNGSTLYLGATELHEAPGSTAVSVSRTYAMGSTVLAERDAAAGSSTSSVFWVTGDVDGTPDLEVDAGSGAVTHRYTDPFGNTRGAAASWSSDRAFLDDPSSTLTGLTQIGARLYDPTTGSFTTADPLLSADSFASRNAYAYAGNSPITNADPSGQCVEPGGVVTFVQNCAGGQKGANKPGSGYAESTPYKQANGYDKPTPMPASAPGGSTIAAPWAGGAVRGAGSAAEVSGAEATAGAGATILGGIATLADVLMMSGDTEESATHATASGAAASTPPPDPEEQCGLLRALACETSHVGDEESNWANPETLGRHFSDHGADFGAANENDYAQMANKFFDRMGSDGVQSKVDTSDGTIRLYEPDTNTFGAYTPDGLTKTFFKPTSPTYWVRQPGVAQ